MGKSKTVRFSMEKSKTILAATVSDFNLTNISVPESNFFFSAAVRGDLTEPTC